MPGYRTRGSCRLHRLCLRLERTKGLLYYLHNKPKGTSAHSLVELQEAIDPRIRHVLQIREENRQYSEDDESSRGDPPPLGLVTDDRPRRRGIQQRRSRTTCPGLT
ncbi:MAG: hypothetical protein U0790_06235 [Isosphaeraceae bacterium]